MLLVCRFLGMNSYQERKLTQKEEKKNETRTI